MGAAFKPNADAGTLPRKAVVLSILCGTLLALMMLVFVGILANLLMHHRSTLPLEAQYAQHRQAWTVLSFIRNHWVAVVLVTVGVGTVLTLVALRTQRRWLLYSLAATSALSYLLMLAGIAWLIMAMIESWTYTLSPQ